MVGLAMHGRERFLRNHHVNSRSYTPVDSRNDTFYRSPDRVD